MKLKVPMTDVCPACKRSFFAAVTDITPAKPPRKPEPGDIGICQDCGAAFIIELDGTFRVLTAAEVAQMTNAQNVSVILRTQSKIRKEK